MADAAAAAVDLILARRAWAVVVRDNDCDDKGEGGDPPVPNDAENSMNCFHLWSFNFKETEPQLLVCAMHSSWNRLPFRSKD